MSLPLVSVVIVAYNSGADLASCLPTLLVQDVPLEIIVVDNCSTDGTSEWLKTTYPHVKCIQNRSNDGYAGANNVGVRAAAGEYIFILNPDTELSPGSVVEMMRVLREHPTTIVTPKLLQPDGTINTCGNRMHYTGITTCNGLGKPADALNGVFPVFLVSGAAFLLHRRVWEDIGGFAEEYFMYMEDMDLSLRARLLGYDILCCAQASILHKWKLGMSPQKFFYLERNRLCTVLKLYELKTVYKLIFSLLFTEFATWAYAFYKGVPFVKARLKGYFSIWHMRKQLKQSRTCLQNRRKLSDADLLSQMLASLPFDMLVSPRIARFLTITTTPFYRAFYVWGNRT